MDFGRPLVASDSIASRSKIRYLALPDDADGDDDDDAILDRMVVQAANQVTREVLLGAGPYEPLASKSIAAEANGTQEDDNQEDVASAGGKNGDGDDDDEADEESSPSAITSDADDALPIPSHLVDASYYKEYSTPRDPQTTIQAGDLVVIMEAFDKLDFVYAKSGDMFYNRNGHFAHDDFIDKLPFGSMVRSCNHRGYGFVYLLKPTPELWARSLNHRTQIVQELDQVQIISKLELRPNLRVMESGTGSGAMSHAILRSIAPHGHLHTFDFNQHRAETARQEFLQHGVAHLVTVAHQDVCADGFHLKAQSMDACFLDLPEPWLAIPHAVYCLRPGARIASYSPCVEQTQRACDMLKRHGCHSLQTMEYRLMEHYVDDAEYDPLPTESRPIHTPVVDANGDGIPIAAIANDDDNDGRVSKTNLSANDDSKLATGPVQKKQRLVARPFNTMKGHTAFLTFATVGNRPQPNPLEKAK